MCYVSCYIFRYLTEMFQKQIVVFLRSYTMETNCSLGQLHVTSTKCFNAQSCSVCSLCSLFSLVVLFPSNATFVFYIIIKLPLSWPGDMFVEWIILRWLTTDIVSALAKLNYFFMLICGYLLLIR